MSNIVIACECKGNLVDNMSSNTGGIGGSGANVLYGGCAAAVGGGGVVLGLRVVLISLMVVVVVLVVVLCMVEEFL